MPAPLDRRALGVELSRAANVTALAGLRSDAAPTSRARRIGVTGAPGAGKSTLIGRLAVERSGHGRLGVIAIDPTSAKSGGAILGDRIRMDDLPGTENVYIRSLSSRTATDGLTDNLPEILDTMDRHGFDEVILETVGVGQVEIAVRMEVDTLVLVLTPDAGDVVQAMKAGISEHADIVVVNKADLPAAPRIAAEIRRVKALTRRARGEWEPPIVLASHTDPTSIASISKAIDRHNAWLRSTGESGARGRARQRYRLVRCLERVSREILEREPQGFFDAPRRIQVATLIERLRASLGE